MLGVSRHIELCARECNIKFKIPPCYKISNGNEQLIKAKDLITTPCNLSQCDEFIMVT